MIILTMPTDASAEAVKNRLTELREMSEVEMDDVGEVIRPWLYEALPKCDRKRLDDYYEAWADSEWNNFPNPSNYSLPMEVLAALAMIWCDALVKR